LSELPNKAYLSPQTVADFYSLPVKTLYSWISEGKVPAIRLGKSNILRIKRDVAEKLAQDVVE
jgi:excisionase family DNA binding protein